MNKIILQKLDKLNKKGNGKEYRYLENVDCFLSIDATGVNVLPLNDDNTINWNFVQPLQNMGKDWENKLLKGDKFFIYNVVPLLQLKLQSQCL
tara:strand:+ start:254 stop:532 length:279 start_codon:yes stop_codon:yes gene_type:complete